MQEQITSGTYNLETGVWKTINDQAKNLIKNLLNINPYERISTEEAMEHPWLNAHKMQSNDDDAFFYNGNF